MLEQLVLALLLVAVAGLWVEAAVRAEMAESRARVAEQALAEALEGARVLRVEEPQVAAGVPRAEELLPLAGQPVTRAVWLRKRFAPVDSPPNRPGSARAPESDPETPAQAQDRETPCHKRRFQDQN